MLTIIKYYNGYVPIDTLRDNLKITKEGTNAYQIVTTAENLGFKATCCKCELQDINKDNIVLPCIANVVINNSYMHFVVIYEINYKKQYLIIADPARKIIKMSFKEFQKIFNKYLIILYPIKIIPRIEENKFNIKYFIDILKNQNDLIKSIIGLSIFITLFSIFSSFYIEYLISGINDTNSNNYLLFIFIVFFIIYLLKNISEYFRNKVLIIINQKLDLILTMDTYNSILSLPYHYYRNRTTGDIISRMNDLSNIKDIISKILLIIIIDLPLTIFSLLFLMLISSALFIIALVILFFYIAIMFIFRKILENNILKIQQDKADITSFMVESISGFETVKGLKIKNYIKNKFEKKYVSFLNRTYKFSNIYELENSLKNIINDLGFVIITFIGSILVLKGTITLGKLFTFNALIIYFLDPIKNILSLDKDLKEAKCALKRMIELKVKNKEPDVTNEKIIGNISFKNLSYTFDNFNYVLKDINLDIKTSEKIMILGPSGSGKSTLLKLLMKYYKVKRGLISIDGKDINDYKHSSNIKYINQIEMLFTDTLYNNLTLGQTIDKNVLNKVIEMCRLTEIINRDQLGLNSIIEENGFNLSGGERQRIVLARTLLTNFDILIIDEGLNQVDIDLERKILKTILTEYSDKTIIVISHRINNNDLYDRIIKFKKGTIDYG